MNGDFPMNAHEKKLTENVVVPLWPDAGKMLMLSRNATCEAAKEGRIATVGIGKLKRVPTAWLRQKLGLAPSNP
jgi:hypothetical protein